MKSSLPGTTRNLSPATIKRLGLTVKSQLAPFQTASYLAVCLDSRSMLATLLDCRAQSSCLFGALSAQHSTNGIDIPETSGPDGSSFPDMSVGSPAYAPSAGLVQSQGLPAHVEPRPTIDSVPSLSKSTLGGNSRPIYS
ncbi:UNVERIFIED_CONTAM: hypothetical protein FKN15_070151 [Acipenser sinensis]